MKINFNTYLVLLVKSIIFFLLLSILSCGNSNNSNNPNGYTTSNSNPDVRDRNNELDGDDTKQPLQDQDSVNRIINENRDKQLDTLPEGIK